MQKFNRFKKNYKENETPQQAPQSKDNQNYEMIDFCGCKVPKVNSDIIRSDLISMVKDISLKTYQDIKPSDDLNKITHFKYSSNGIRCLLMFVEYQNRMRSYIIDQNNNRVDIICTRFRVTPEIYKGSLFDGELVYSRRGKWLFLINECLMLSGKYQDYNLDKNLLNDSYLSDFVLEIAEMRFNQLYDIEVLKKITQKELSDLDFQIKGFNLYTKKGLNRYKIQLTENSENVNMEQNPEEDNKYNDKIITFACQETFLPDVFQLYLMNENTLQKMDIAHIQSLEMSEKINEEFKKTKQILIDCKYSTKFKKWYPIQINTDKKLPDQVNHCR